MDTEVNKLNECEIKNVNIPDEISPVPVPHIS